MRLTYSEFLALNVDTLVGRALFCLLTRTITDMLVKG